MTLLTKWLYFVNDERGADKRPEADGHAAATSGAGFLPEIADFSGLAEGQPPSLIGYAASFPGDTESATQRRALEAAGCSYVFDDIVLNESARRRGLEALMDIVRPGDGVVVWRLERLILPFHRLVDQIGSWSRRDIGFIAISENVDTRGEDGAAALAMLESFTSYERGRSSERARAAAQSPGRQPGRPRALSEDQIDAVRAALEDEGQTVARLAGQYRVHPRTLYRLLREARKRSGPDDI